MKRIPRPKWASPTLQDAAIEKVADIVAAVSARKQLKDRRAGRKVEDYLDADGKPFDAATSERLDAAMTALLLRVAPFVEDRRLVMPNQLEDLRERSPDKPFDQLLIDLVASNVELKPETRRYIGTELKRLYFSNPITPARERREKGRAFAASVSLAKEMLKKAGLPGLEAESEIADALDISVDALRKRLQRTPKKQ